MDGDLLLWPLWPEPSRGMLLGVVFPGSATAPHYLSIGQLADFINAGGISLPLGISDGGTGQVTAADALAALGGAPIVDAHLVGNPTAPTPAAGDSSTRIATTAFVTATASSPSWDNVTNKPASFPPTLPIPQSGVTGLVSDLALKAPLAGPVFTGNPQAPTPPPGDSDTSIATTAFVAASLAALPPASSVTVSDTAPASPAAGDLWFDSASANLFVRYADPNTTQWVVAVNQPGPQGPTGETGPAGATGPAGQTWTVGTGLTLAANTISLTTPALPLAGGTLTGTLTIAPPSGWSTFALNKSAGSNANNLMGYVAGLGRWDILIGDNTAETGSNVGTNFSISRYTDAGAWNGNAIAINRATGACSNTGGTWTAISDGSLKQGIRPFTRGLEALEALRPISFRYRSGTPFAGHDKPSARLLGMIAQDVAPHVPEIVGTMSVEVDGQAREVRTLDTGNLVFLLINAVRELSARVAALEANR